MSGLDATRVTPLSPSRPEESMLRGGDKRGVRGKRAGARRSSSTPRPIFNRGEQSGSSKLVSTCIVPHFPRNDLANPMGILSWLFRNETPQVSRQVKDELTCLNC